MSYRRAATASFIAMIRSQAGPNGVRVPPSPGLVMWRLLVCGVLACGVVGCGAEPVAPAPAAVREVIDGTRWQAIPRDKDPFVSAMPAAVTTCVSSGVTVEDAMLEMDTGICGFISATTPLTTPVAKGERVKITLWHLPLYADPPAMGVMRIHIGGAEVWRLDVAIPHQEQVYEPELKAQAAWPAGTAVDVHVHNHGSNSWKVYQIKAGG